MYTYLCNDVLEPHHVSFEIAAQGCTNFVYFDSGQSLGNAVSYDVSLGDVDGDGDLDAFAAHGSFQANEVWLYDGVGGYTNSGQSLGGSKSFAIALGDVDGDSDLDAFVANENQANKVWLNNGNGTFTDSFQFLGSAWSYGIALGDVDGDGDLDAFVANRLGQPNKVWLNNGSGTFTDSGQSLGSSQSFDVSLGDLDGDGDLDAFVANWVSQGNIVWLNSGNGIFTGSGQSLGTSWSHGIALGDVDADGDLDAFVANESGQANKVWVNNGGGIFSDSGQSLGSSWSYGTSFGDMDADGDLDAFVANFGQANKVWINNGGGTFSDSGQSLRTNGSYEVALGDINADGKLDAFVANVGQGDRVWLNECEFTITATSTGNGVLAPSGSVVIAAHAGTNFAITADPTYEIGDVLVDDLSVGAVTNYVFTDIISNHTISATFARFMHVTGAAPSNGAVGVSVSNAIDVTIDDAVDLGTVAHTNFTVRSRQYDRHPGAYSLPATNIARFTPSTNFLAGEHIEVALIGSIISPSGSILRAYQFEFDAAAEGCTNFSFPDSGQSLGSSRSWRLALGDLDGDGDLDAFVANSVSQPNTVWINDGDGAFTNSGQNLENEPKYFPMFGQR